MDNLVILITSLNIVAIFPSSISISRHSSYGTYKNVNKAISMLIVTLFMAVRNQRSLMSQIRVFSAFMLDSIMVIHSRVHCAAMNKNLCMNISNKHNVEQKETGTKDHMLYVIYI